MLRRAMLRLLRAIVAVTAIALYCGVSLQLTGTVAPWAMWEALMPPTPERAAVRKALSELAGRTNAGPVDAADLAAATAFYGRHGGPLLWVTQSGISPQGNALINEIRKADDWGLRARDFVLPQLPAGSVSLEAGAE